MRERGRKLCALLLGVAMLGSGLPAGMQNVSAAEEGTDSGSAQAKGVVKETNVAVEENFEGGGLSAEWLQTGDEGSIVCSDNSLTLKDAGGGQYTTVKRNIGNNGSFTAEIHWSNYDNPYDKDNSLMVFGVNDGTGSNGVEIRRFRDGWLGVRIAQSGADKYYDATILASENGEGGFQEKEGWFRLGYDNNTQTVTAEYKAGDMTDYVPMNGSGTELAGFNGKHVAE